MPSNPLDISKPTRSLGPATLELLLEIGTEELPYQFVAPTLRALHYAAEAMLKDLRIAYGSIRTMGTPRRLVLLIDQVARRQAAAVKETMGPSKAVAFDQAGGPTKAAIGFAAGQGVSVDQLQIRQTPKGEYLFAVKKEKGKPAQVVLVEELPQLLAKLSFPKAMHWNETGLRFARPVRWLIALCGGKVLPIQFATLQAGNRSQGHRVLNAMAKGAKGFTVKSIAQYLQEAERHGVIVDQARRRSMILDQLSDLATSAGGRLHQDDELLEQAVYMVEYPYTILGSFKPHYLALPKEILMTSMKEHQGYFSLVDAAGGLLPNFLAVTNMKLPDMQLIREGNERVLAARLADAKFFYDEDRKTPLAERAKKLAQVTFHQKLGTLAQKQERVKKLTGIIASSLDPQNESCKQSCERAASLAKADLLTGMVGEFPELQGIMGSEYARHDGESEMVSAAIREQYLPRSIEGALPKTFVGQVLSIADRMDSLAAFFYIGIIPTGSEDPFALRRHATAVVRILLEGDHKLNLSQLIDQARKGVIDDGFKGTADSDQQGRHRVAEFLFERLRHYGRTVLGLREDVIEAVLKGAPDRAFDLGNLVLRMTAIQTIASQPDFAPLIVGFKRAHRLTEKEQWDRKPVDVALFREAAESALHQTLQKSQDQYSTAVADGKFTHALDLLVQMKGPIDDFFNAVMVNADDSAVRGNRLSLLKEVDDLFMSFADFSQIMVQGT
jgi:glycyl-tRNA synthetase beta chain